MKPPALKKTLLRDLLVKTTHQKVLAFFLARPSGHFYGSEIAKKTGVSTGQVSKILNDLGRAGLVEKESKGKTELYRVLMESAVLRTYKVLNTLISIDPLVGELRKVSKLVILYGSCAKGTNVEDSDLDLLVVSSVRDGVLDVVAGYPYDKRRGFSEIKPVIKRPAVWAALEHNDPTFYGELQKGILLYEKEVDESRL